MGGPFLTQINFGKKEPLRNQTRLIGRPKSPHPNKEELRNFKKKGALGNWLKLSWLKSKIGGLNKERPRLRRN